MEKLGVFIFKEKNTVFKVGFLANLSPYFLLLHDIFYLFEMCLDCFKFVGFVLREFDFDV